MSSSAETYTPDPPRCKTAIERVTEYLEVGLAPIPIPRGEKGPVIPGWQALSVSKEDIPSYFSGDANIGVRLGSASGDLADVDLDCDEALKLAPTFLPPTITFGRLSRPESHRLYKSPGLNILFKLTDPARSPKDNTLLEIRAKPDVQTVFPDSLHPSGERIRWEREGIPTEILAYELVKRVKYTGAGALMLRHWPGDKLHHETCLAVGSMLARLKWTEDQIIRFVTTVAELAGAGDPKDRANAAIAGIRRLEENRGKPVYGLPKLRQLFGKDVADRIAEWLGYTFDDKSDDDTWEFELTAVSSVPMEPVRWLWPGRLILGKLNLFVGHPGMGKTTVALDATARITKGLPWPCDESGFSASKGTVLWVTSEDDIATTLRPRLEAAGADTTKVFVLECLRNEKGERKPLEITEDIARLEELLRQHPETIMIVLDPISEYLGKVESHTNAKVRAALGPFVKLADRHAVALLGITHTTKARQSTVHGAAIESIAFSALSRATSLIEEEMVEVVDEETGKPRQEPTGRTLFAVIKCNLAEPSERQTLAFTIQPKYLAIEPVGELKTSIIEWNEVVNVSARDIWEEEQGSKKLGAEPKKLEEAVAFILSAMFSRIRDDGRPEYRERKSEDVKQAALDAGIKPRTYEAAKKKLGIRVEMREGRVNWLIPDELNSRQVEIPF